MYPSPFLNLPWLAYALLLLVVPRNVASEERKSLRSNTLSTRSLFNVDGTVEVNGPITQQFNLLDRAYSDTDTSATTQVFQMTPTVPAGTTVTCELDCSTASTSSPTPVKQLSIKFGSIFTSRSDGSPLVIDNCPGSHSATLASSTTSTTASASQSGYVMVTNIGDSTASITDATVQCTSSAAPSSPVMTTPSLSPTTSSPISTDSGPLTPAPFAPSPCPPEEESGTSLWQWAKDYWKATPAYLLGFFSG